MLDEVLPTPSFCDAMEISILSKLNLSKTHWVILIVLLIPTRINDTLLYCQHNKHDHFGEKICDICGKWGFIKRGLALHKAKMYKARKETEATR